MNNFTQRLLSGIVFVVLLIGCTVYSSYSFLGMFLIVCIGGNYEFLKLISLNHVKPDHYFAHTSSALLFCTAALYCLNLNYMPVALLSLLSLFGIFIAALYTASDKPFLNIAVSLTSVIYVALPLSLFVMFAFINGNFQWQLALGYLILQWSSDTGQYCSGMLLGKRKLFERISPKKSWEGFIGGFIFTVAIGYVIANFYTQLLAWQWMSIAAIIVVFGTMGDLVESLLKRSVGVKDSGSIMPGHGGFLDRFDALIGSAPFVYAFIKLTALI